MLFSFFVYLSTFFSACYVASNGEKTVKNELKRMRKEHGTAFLNYPHIQLEGLKKSMENVMKDGVGTRNRKHHFQNTNTCKIQCSSPHD